MTSHVLVDHFSEPRSRTMDFLWIAGFSLLTGLLAQIEIKLPYTVVPLTGQTFGVLLAGAVLGCRRGFLSQLAYLAEGALGLPVFAGGAFGLVHLLGPTGGYLWSYPLAAGLVGWLVERGAGRRVPLLAASLVLADALILLAGAAWLRLFLAVPFSRALLLGFYPFLIGDILKLVLVGGSLPQILKRLPSRA